jgi:hypothetical protein
MCLVKDPQGKAHKLNYLFLLAPPLTMGPMMMMIVVIIINLQTLPLITFCGVIDSHICAKLCLSNNQNQCKLCTITNKIVKMKSIHI